MFSLVLLLHSKCYTLLLVSLFLGGKHLTLVSLLLGEGGLMALREGIKATNDLALLLLLLLLHEGHFSPNMAAAMA